jgi:hypothetical protein
MSHTTTLKGVEIKDRVAIVAAVKELKAKGVAIELRENAKWRGYFTHQGRVVDLVLHLTNCPYDIGLKLDEKGHYQPEFDLWANKVSQQLGADAQVCALPGTDEGKAQHAIGQFMAAYAKHASINAASAQGYTYLGETLDKQGNTHLEFEQLSVAY